MNVLILIITPSTEWDQDIWIWNLCFHDANYLERRKGCFLINIRQVEKLSEIPWHVGEETVEQTRGPTWTFGRDRMHLYQCPRLCSLPNVVSGFPLSAKDEFFQNSHCYPSEMCKCLKITAYSAVSTQGTWKAGQNFFLFMHLCSHFYCHFCALCEEIERRVEMLDKGCLGTPWCFHGHPNPAWWKDGS